MLGVLLPASTSASIKVTPVGKPKGETSAAVADLVQSGLKMGERARKSC